MSGSKNESLDIVRGSFGNTFSRFGRTLTCDRQTDRQTQAVATVARTVLA